MNASKALVVASSELGSPAFEPKSADADSSEAVTLNTQLSQLQNLFEQDNRREMLWSSH